MPTIPKRLRSVLTQEFRTSKILWAVISAALFVWLGAVDMHFGKEPPYWDKWAIFLTGNYINGSEMALVLILWAFLLGAPSIVVGWVLQGFLIAGIGWQSAAHHPDKNASDYVVGNSGR